MPSVIRKLNKSKLLSNAECRWHSLAHRQFVRRPINDTKSDGLFYSNEDQPKFYSNWKGQLFLKSGVVVYPDTLQGKQQQQEYDRLNTINKSKNAFKKFKGHLCDDKLPQFFKKKCKSCGSDFELDLKGKPISYRRTCGSPYCTSEVCFDQRYSVAKEYLMLFFNAYPSWRTTRGDRWGHSCFGFKRQSLPTKEELALIGYQALNFIEAWARRYHFRIKGIGVRDIAFDIEIIDEEFYIHIHFFHRPLPQPHDKKKFAGYLKEVNALAQKYGLKYNWFGYRKAKWCADYLAKRHAGKFEHEKNDSNWMFADVMDEQTYFKTFHNTRKILHYGFTRKEIRYLKAKAQEIRKTEGFALSSKDIPTARATSCQNCGHNLFIFVPIEENNPYPPDPPPDRNLEVLLKKKFEVFCSEQYGDPLNFYGEKNEN